jgi:hypothetical protein
MPNVSGSGIIFTLHSPARTLRCVNFPLSVVTGPSQTSCTNDPSLRTAPPPLAEKMLSRRVCALTEAIRISSSCSAGPNPLSPANPVPGKINAAQVVPTTFNTCLRSYSLLMYADPWSCSVSPLFSASAMSNNMRENVSPVTPSTVQPPAPASRLHPLLPPPHARALRI